MVLRPLDPSEPADRDLVVAIATHAGVRWRCATRTTMSLHPVAIVSAVQAACSYLFAVETDGLVHGLAGLADVDTTNQVATVDLVVGPGPDAAAAVADHAAPAVRLLLDTVPLRRVYFERFADEPFPFPQDAHRWVREVVLPDFAVFDGRPVAFETWSTTPADWER